MLLRDFEPLLAPRCLWTREQVLVRSDCPVPRDPGLYAWYFRTAPRHVPTEDCHHWQGMPLLYVGISPKRPPANGAPPSRQRLRNRVRYHFRGNAYGSTLRLTLGCLLADELGIQLQRVGSGTRLTFAEGEAILSEWMGRNARVAWMPHDKPWEAEHELIANLSLPLNLQDNERHPFHGELSSVRDRSRVRARSDDVYAAPR